MVILMKLLKMVFMSEEEHLVGLGWHQQFQTAGAGMRCLPG